MQTRRLDRSWVETCCWVHWYDDDDNCLSASSENWPGVDGITCSVFGGGTDTDPTMRVSPHGLSRAGGGDKELAGNAPGLDDDVFLNIPAVRIEEASQVYRSTSPNESGGDSRNSVPAAGYQS